MIELQYLHNSNQPSCVNSSFVANNTLHNVSVVCTLKHQVIINQMSALPLCDILWCRY